MIRCPRRRDLPSPRSVAIFGVPCLFSRPGPDLARRGCAARGRWQFYEMFEGDADVGHQHLHLKLTDRTNMRMCGVPEGQARPRSLPTRSHRRATGASLDAYECCARARRSGARRVAGASR